MQDEMARILELVSTGTLTPDQAAELIRALGEAPRASTEPPPNEPRHRRDERRHRRHRHRSWGAHSNHEHVSEDIQRAVDFGTRTLRAALKSGFGWSSAWSGTTNSAIFSRTEPPSGQDYTCEHNQLAVSHLRGLRLDASTFSHNELDAAGLEDVELVQSTFTGQRLRGSSLRGALLEHSQMRDNELNGARLSRLTVGHGRVDANVLNGSQLRDVGVSASVMEDCRLDGARIKTWVINQDSHLKNLRLSGVLGRNWLFEGAVISNTSISGQRVDGLVLKRAGLEDVVTRVSDMTARMTSTGLVRDLTLERVVLKRCSFVDCVFDGTRFEGFDAADLEFDGVDFRGLVITSADELARLAADRQVA